VTWFAWQTYVRLGGLVRANVPAGLDVQIYYRGVQAWLNGQDPWSAQVTVSSRAVFNYSGSPATTVLFAPSALLSEGQFTALWLVLTAASAVAILRLLKLPLWWLLFPPIVEAMYSGNPQIVVLMLLLAGTGRLGAVTDSIATAIKVYAVFPLMEEPGLRRVVPALALTVATFAIAPALWISYVREFGEISARLAAQSNMGYSAFYFPLLAIPTAIALILLSRRDPKAAAWLVVPALWPASEFHYSTFALPVMTPLLAVLLAVPTLRLAPVAIVLYVVWRFASEPVHARLAAWEAEASPASAPKDVRALP
jgi:hypothetical protein